MYDIVNIGWQWHHRWDAKLLLLQRSVARPPMPKTEQRLDGTRRWVRDTFYFHSNINILIDSIVGQYFIEVFENENMNESLNHRYRNLH